MRAFIANSMTVVRAYTYIRAYGGKGLKEVSENAVLNANYLFSQLKRNFKAPYDRHCMHEFVLEATFRVTSGTDRDRAVGQASVSESRGPSAVADQAAQVTRAESATSMRRYPLDW